MKKKFANGLGLTALAVLLMFLCGVSIYRGYQNRSTKISLDNTAASFAKGDTVVIEGWSKGNVLDFWGIPLQRMDIGEEKFQFKSAGPDGIFETEDDIEGKIVEKQPPPKPGVFRSLWNKIRGNEE